MRLNTIVLLLLTGLLTGCAGKTPSQKEQATAQWNTARATVLASLAKDQFESGNWEKARQTVDEAAKLDPRNANIQVLSARIWIERGQLEVAERILQAARQLDPKSAAIDYFSGIVYQRWQQPEKAYQYYASAMEKSPTDPAHVLAAAEMLVQNGRLTDAIALLAEKSIGFENNATLLDAWGRLVQQMGRCDDALVLLRRAAMLGTDDPSIREHLALCLLESHQYPEAAELLERLCKNAANENRGDLLIALGECQLQMGRTADAKATLEQASNLNPECPAVWIGLAKASLRSGDLARADISARRAISIDVRSTEGYLIIGQLRLKQNRLADSLKAFQRANAIDASNTVALCMIGFVLERSGQPDLASTYYARALKLNPSDVLSRELLAGASD